MKYIYYTNTKWSHPVTEKYLRRFWKKYCLDYASEFEDWFADMKRYDLIREV